MEQPARVGMEALIACSGLSAPTCVFDLQFYPQHAIASSREREREHSRSKGATVRARTSWRALPHGLWAAPAQTEQSAPVEISPKVESCSTRKKGFRGTLG